MNDLLKLAIVGHGCAQRWMQISRFRGAACPLFGLPWAIAWQRRRSELG